MNNAAAEPLETLVTEVGGRGAEHLQQLLQHLGWWLRFADSENRQNSPLSQPVASDYSKFVVLRPRHDPG